MNVRLEVLLKYNTLDKYEEYLSTRFTTGTAATYKKCVDTLLKDQFLLDCKNMNIALILSKFESMKYKNEYSKYKNAFLKFCEFQNIKIDSETMLKLNLMALDKKKKHRRMKAVNLKDIKNHLRAIKDTKLKLSYETILATGLRVSELSQIGKNDCSLHRDKIVFSFIGKGGNPESVTIFKDDNPTLFTDITKLVNSSKKKVFYSPNYLQTKAKEKGFGCHDLRRAYAKLEHQKHKDIIKTREALRHKSEKNTRRYLNSKVKI